MTKALPALWMKRVCTRSAALVVPLYAEQAVLIPTYDKSDLPGAGTGGLVGHDQIMDYFQRFLSKPNLCGTIDTMVVQELGPVTVFSGSYTFRWKNWAERARYTFVVCGSCIMTHHSSEDPA